MNEMARNEKFWTYNSSEMAHNRKIRTYNKKNSYNRLQLHTINNNINKSTYNTLILFLGAFHIIVRRAMYRSRTWVSDKMATYLARGLRFNKSVYMEICQILRHFDTVAAIIPEDEKKNMKYLITRFFQLYEELGHDTSDVASYLRVFM
jgi:hypothetical protein